MKKQLILLIVLSSFLALSCDSGKSALQKKMEEAGKNYLKQKNALAEKNKEKKKPKFEQEKKKPLPPIVKAAKDGNLEKVKTLSASVDINTTDDSKRTPFYMACSTGNLEIAKFLLDKGAKMLPREDGDTPLMAAARNKRKEIVEFLLEKGVDVNKADNFGRTPLMAAAQGGDKEIVELLLKHKANLDAKDKFGGSALITAMKYKHMDLAKWLLIDKKAKVWKEKQVKLRKKLLLRVNDKEIEKNVKILNEAQKNSIKLRHKTELFYAVQTGDLDLVKLLVKRGAPIIVNDVKIKRETIVYPHKPKDIEKEYMTEEIEKRTAYDETQKNLLMYAAQKGYVDIMKFLIKHGAMLEETDGETVRGPLFYVVSQPKGTPEFEKKLAQTAEYIIKEGKKTWKKKRRLTKTELRQMREKNKNKSWYDKKQVDVEFKFETLPKVNIEAYDWEGWTVLCLAAKNGHYEVVKTLINNNVMVNRKERKFGRTALIYSRVGHYPRIEKILKEHGALEGINFNSEELAKKAKAKKEAEKKSKHKK